MRDMRSSTSPNLIVRLVEAIAADPAGDHSTAAMAARVGVSRRHLSRLFAEHVGTTPAREVKRVRVTVAQSLLAANGGRLPDVAARAGFGSPETMRRAFRRTLGLSPGAYRATHGSRNRTVR
jgi:transcriptional regulator GlxA family with amidase domain